MMRANASPTSPYYAVLFNPGGSATIQWRNYDGVPDAAARWRCPRSPRPPTCEIVSSDTDPDLDQFFSTLTSADGVNWTPVLGSTQAIHMGTTYLAGMAATPARPGSPRRSSTTPSPWPRRPPSRPGSARPVHLQRHRDQHPARQPDLPDPAAGRRRVRHLDHPGQAARTSGRSSTTSASSPRASRTTRPTPPNGDGTVSARVVSQANPGGPWTKTGVMIRSSATDPQAPYYGVFVTPANGVMVQWRPAEAAETNQVLATPAAARHAGLGAGRAVHRHARGSSTTPASPPPTGSTGRGSPAPPWP